MSHDALQERVFFGISCREIDAVSAGIEVEEFLSRWGREADGSTARSSTLGAPASCGVP